MSDIANLAGNLGSARVASPFRPETTARPSVSPTAQRHGRGEDAIEISDDARRLGAARPVAEPDLEKVARVKSEIAAGGYDSDARFQAASGRLIDDAIA
jgi:anti-sigma28 factor (negative regulator of flagellin synthesis)